MRCPYACTSRRRPQAQPAASVSAACGHACQELTHSRTAHAAHAHPPAGGSKLSLASLRVLLGAQGAEWGGLWERIQEVVLACLFVVQVRAQLWWAEPGGYWPQLLLQFLLVLHCS